MGSRAEIVQLCMNVAEHIEQCYDFEIQQWLDKYENLKNEVINFGEAAFLIYSVARIYSRKVDYLEKVILEFNQRGAADVAAAAADAEAQHHKDNGANNEQSTSAETPKPKEKDKEKPKRGSKKLLKPSGRIEFKPKEFTIADISQISLNLDIQPRTIEDEFGDDQLRMKNVFPRINVLQSNLRSNNRFFENLELNDKDCDITDTLRDYRLFMDTIDEPIRTSSDAYANIHKIMTYDPTKDNGKRKPLPRDQAVCHVYLPAAYIKEQYNVDIEDNSEYYNMLRYNAEVERLKLSEMTQDELMDEDLGTYLNDVLNGSNESGLLPPLDNDSLNLEALAACFPSSRLKCKRNLNESALNVSSMDHHGDHDDTTLIDTTVDNTMDTTAAETTVNSLADTTANTDIDTTIDSQLNETINDDTIANTTADESAVNTTADESAVNTTADESAVNTTADESAVNTMADETMNTTTDPNDIASTSINVDGERAAIRQSLDDGIGVSPITSPAQAVDVDIIDKNIMAPVVEMHDIFYPINNDLPADLTVDLTGPMKELLKMDQGPKVPLESNIFALPEQMLRRSKLFKLTDDFDIWLAARKRKSCGKPEASGPKIFKMFDGTMVMVSSTDPDALSCISENEVFFGFDDMNISSLSFSIIRDPAVLAKCSRVSSIDGEFSGFNEQENGAEQPGSIVNRSFSNDSGIQAEKLAAIEATDSGVADLGLASEMGECSTSGANDVTTTNGENTENNLETTTIDGDKIVVAPTVADSGFSEIESLLLSEANETIAVAADESDITITPLADETLVIETVSNENQDVDKTLTIIDTSLVEMKKNDTIESVGSATDVTDNVPDTVDQTNKPGTSRDDLEKEVDDQNRDDEMQAMVHRVSKWHNTLQPILAQSEQRNNFDINALGSDIIDMFPENEPSKEITFADVMENRDQSYTARYFLSLLLLTNTENIHITRSNPEMNGKTVCRREDLNIKLLSRARHLDNVHQIDEHLEKNRMKRPAEEPLDCQPGPSHEYASPSVKKRKTQKK